jgi:heterotetrameric sarcosine oxidase gamma subunit
VEEEMELVSQLNSVFPNKCAHAAAFTDHLCWLEFAGAASLDFLLEGTFLSLERRGLPVGCAKRTLIAQVATIVVRESKNRWLLAVERSRAAYFIDWLIAVAKDW